MVRSVDLGDTRVLQQRNPELHDCLLATISKDTDPNHEFFQSPEFRKALKNARKGATELLKTILREQALLPRLYRHRSISEDQRIYSSTMQKLPVEDQLALVGSDPEKWGHHSALAFWTEDPEVIRAFFERADTLPGQALGQILSRKRDRELIEEFFLQRVDELSPRELIYLIASPVITREERQELLETKDIPVSEENAEIVYRKVCNFFRRAMDFRNEVVLSPPKRGTKIEELQAYVDWAKKEAARLTTEERILSQLTCEYDRGGHPSPLGAPLGEHLRKRKYKRPTWRVMSQWYDVYGHIDNIDHEVKVTTGTYSPPPIRTRPSDFMTKSHKFPLRGIRRSRRHRG